MNDPMPAPSADSEPPRESKTGPVAWFVARGLEGPRNKPAAWDLVRALVLVGFVVFAAITSLTWLHLNITKPFKNEIVNLRNTYAVTPVEQDVALLLRWLPSQGKVGYLSDKQGLPRFEANLRLAPLLLDSSWTRHEWVLVDGPVRQGLAELESPRYQLVTDLPEAKAFARGMRIYKRRP
jgi:hypothetical protein